RGGAAVATTARPGGDAGQGGGGAAGARRKGGGTGNAPGGAQGTPVRPAPLAPGGLGASGAGIRRWAVPHPSTMCQCSTSGAGRCRPAMTPSGPGAKAVPRIGARRAATTVADRYRRGGGVEAAHICRRTLAGAAGQVVDTRYTAGFPP